jgi:hypothetical protein
MLETYRAELSKEISDSLRSIGRWGGVVVVGVTLLVTVGDVVPGWICNVVQGGLLGATLGMLAAANGVFHVWSRRRQADMCLANARWVLRVRFKTRSRV